MAIAELVVISGKGGTGKTVTTASLAPFFDNAVLADCDVDAPDLHILFAPQLEHSEEFIGARKAEIDSSRCIRCGRCVESCRFGAIDGEGFTVNQVHCEGCGVCRYVCPAAAVTLKDAVVGRVSRSRTAYGPLVHAQLIPGEEASGKLVTRVRTEAKRIAEAENRSVILIDGSPGIGCNVISSITGARVILVVTEPTRSGLHDLERVLATAEKFTAKIFVVINKYDLSGDMSSRIRKECRKRNVEVVLQIPFNTDIVKAVSEREIPSLAEKRFFEAQGWNGFVKRLVQELS